MAEETKQADAAQTAKDNLGELAEKLGMQNLDVTAEIMKITKLIESLDALEIAMPEAAEYSVELADGGKETIVIQELSVGKRRMFDKLLEAQTGSPATLEAYPEGINAVEENVLWKLFSITEDRRIDAIVVCCDNPKNLRNGKPLVTREWVEENMTETDMANVMGLYNQRHIPALLARVKSLAFSDAAHLTMMPGVGGKGSIIGT